MHHLGPRGTPLYCPLPTVACSNLSSYTHKAVADARLTHTRHACRRMMCSSPRTPSSAGGPHAMRLPPLPTFGAPPLGGGLPGSFGAEPLFEGGGLPTLPLFADPPPLGGAPSFAF